MPCRGMCTSVIRDPDDSNKRIFAQCKCNNAPDNLSALRYEMTRAMIPSPRGEIETAFPVWDSEPVQLDLRDAMAATSGRRGPQPERTTEVAEWLIDYLRAAGKPVEQREAWNDAGKKGFVGSYRQDNEDKWRWSNPRILYLAIKAIPLLPSPATGG